MTRLKSVVAVIAAAGLVATAGQAGAASGGGGGTGGGMPSASGPSYDPVAEHAKGIAALQSGDFRAAEKAFDRVTSVAARDPNSWYLLGLARSGKEDHKGARKAYERALKFDAEHIAAQRQLGVTLAKLNQPAPAQAALGKLKARAATCGTTCAEAADLTAAVAAVEAAIATPGATAGAAPAQSPAPGAALSPSLAPPELLFVDAGSGDRAYGRAMGLINEQRYDAALQALTEAQAAFGPHPDVLTLIGYAHRKLGRADVAEVWYRQALAVAPAHRGATEYYGELKVERGDIAGAKVMLAALDETCTFGCAEAEELRRWINAGRDPAL